MYKVTIVIPFFNAAKTLDSAIKSCLNQTIDNYKILLIDDGSKDDSLRVAKKYQSDKVVLVSDDKNLGLPRRLNDSLKYVDTPYLARMDADDLMHPDRLRRQLEVLENDSSIDLTSTAYYRFYSDNFIALKSVSYQEDCVLNKHVIYSGGAILHPSVTGKTSWFTENPYISNYPRCEDQELWMRTVDHTKIFRLKAKLMFYRIDSIADANRSIPTLFQLSKLYFSNRFYFKSLKLLLHSILYKLFSFLGLLEKYLMFRTRKIQPSQDDIDSLKNILSGLN